MGAPLSANYGSGVSLQVGRRPHAVAFRALTAVPLVSAPAEMLYLRKVGATANPICLRSSTRYPAHLPNSSEAKGPTIMSTTPVSSDSLTEAIQNLSTRIHNLEVRL
jgi:hypothetical protein